MAFLGVSCVQSSQCADVELQLSVICPLCSLLAQSF